MRNDPTRRFTYGMTTENKNLRMWLCHRTAVIASGPINFIRVIESFLLARAAMTLTWFSFRIV